MTEMASTSPLFLCDMCPLSFTLKANLDRHQLKKHSANTCENCKKVFPRWDIYYRHAAICTRPSLWPHECETCKKVFHRRDHYKRHIAICKGPVVKKVPICKICNKVFSNNYNLKKHTNAQCCNGRVENWQKITNKPTNYADVEKNVTEVGNVDTKLNIQSEYQDFGEAGDVDTKLNTQSEHQDFDEPTAVINAEHKETNYSEVEQNVSETDGVGRKRKNQSEDQERVKKQRLEDGSEAIEKTIQIVINVKIL